MRPLIIFAIGLVAACSTTPLPEPHASKVRITVDSFVANGAVTGAALVNESGTAIEVGPVPCQVFRDKLEWNSWVSMGQSAVICRQQAFAIADGASFDFEFLAPESAVYRLRTVVQGDTVFSDPFMVH